MVQDYLDEIYGKKKTSNQRFKNVNQAFSYLVEKERQKKIKQDALKKVKQLQRLRALQQNPVMESVNIQGQQIAQSIKRQGIIRNIGDKAHRIENAICSINEIGFLNNLESARAEVLTPPDKALTKLERDIVNSFPA